MKQVENVFGCGLLSVIFRACVVSHIQSMCNLTSTIEIPAIINEDNTACIIQIDEDTSKVIEPIISHQKFFYTRKL